MLGGPGRLILRADAGPAIGAGHVMRMLALAQAWQDRGGEPLIVSVNLPKPFVRKFEEEGIATRRISSSEVGGLIDAEATAAIAKETGSRWVVLDGYGFGSSYQEALRSAGFKVLAVDDHGYEDTWCVDALLNQNLSADSIDYSRIGRDTKLLTGLNYALLRREFSQPTQGGLEPPGEIHRLLVTLGGGDPDNATGRVLRLLEALDHPGLEIRALIGSQNPHRAEVSEQAARSRHKIELLTNVKDMPEQFLWADGVISAAGSTCWEWLRYDLPAAVVVIADNQEGIARSLEENGLAVNLGWHDRLDRLSRPTLVRDMLTLRRENRGAACRESLDGAGAKRVAALFAESLDITILTEPSGWMRRHAPRLESRLSEAGHNVRVVTDPEEATSGDILFMLSVWGIVTESTLRRYTNSLVVHESDLPRGRGWSPVSWDVLAGSNDITVCLLEAAGKVDSGPIYLRTVIELTGGELIDEIRERQAEATFQLCEEFVARYPEIVGGAEQQTGEPSYFPRRRPADSELDPEKTLAEQFDLLRIVDNQSYPAFFSYRGRRFELRISPGGER